jgi:hypothetical protein
MASSEQRKNRAPVFIHGLQGGGTGILWNFITSHPDFLGPRYETNQIFMYDWWRFLKAVPRARKYGYQIPNMLALIPLARRHGIPLPSWKIFAYDDHHPRSPDPGVKPGLARAVDARLHDLKVDHGLRPTGDREDEKFRGVSYSRSEIDATRLAAKNIEGLCFLQPFFQDTFSDAKFIAITRDGLASCESKLRHGRAHSVEHAAEVYRDEVGYMLESSKTDDSCMLLRYEDLMCNPLEEIQRVYEFVGIPFTPEQEFRMATREFIGRDKSGLAGRAVQAGKDWFSQAELVEGFVQPDVNRRAIERLSPSNRSAFLRIAGPVMEELGYI